MGELFAILGRWNANPGSVEGGLGFSLLRYDAETGGMEMLDTMDPDTVPGSQCYNAEKHVLYIGDEKEQRDDWSLGGGGYINAYRLDPETGTVTFLNRKPSLGVCPSFVALDESGKYLLVTHHGKQNHATTVVRNADGSFESRLVVDDAALVLFRLEEDGSLGEVCDVSVKPGVGVTGRHIMSHLHSVCAAPGGELFFVCDKGNDKVYTYRLDREQGRLEFLCERSVKEGSAPRYAVIHPTQPYIFQNNENMTDIHVWKYDTDSGELEPVCVAPLFTAEQLSGYGEKGVKPSGFVMYGPSDILLSRDGRHLYCSVRKADVIVMMDIAEDGRVAANQIIHCQGSNPRGLCLSPDGRFLFAVNMVSGNIARFAVGSDGVLRFDGYAAENVKEPANLVIREL